jgi:C-terminal processing protease CtpA/Prc
VTFVRAAVGGSIPVDGHLLTTSLGWQVGYLFIPSFADMTVADQVRQAMQDFGPVDAMILDNRFNSGGRGRVADPILNLFVSGPVGAFVSREGRRPVEAVPELIYGSQDIPIVVLVSEDTVSFGEIFSGILRNLGRAVIIGETTLGNVEVLRGYELSDGSKLWIAQERFEPLYEDEDWEETGIVPDIEVVAEWDTFTFDTDPAVAAALRLLDTMVGR